MKLQGSINTSKYGVNHTAFYRAPSSFLKGLSLCRSLNMLLGARMLITSRKINTVPSILEAERARGQIAVRWLE